MLEEKIVVVDLNSGRYVDDFRGHELFNLEKNPLDGMYYGYVPPYDGINIKKLDETATESVLNVLVVYVQAISKEDKNREIIAYCENAEVFGSPQKDKEKSRQFKDTDGEWDTATYSIKSDNLTDLRQLTNKFKIKIADYNPYMFRGQRSYLENYPDLKMDILNYVFNQKNMDINQDIEQLNIQLSEPASEEFSAEYGKSADEFIQIHGTKQVKKNATIAKKVLVDNDYICACDPEHTTFMTPTGNCYMEGHHLIPCTIENSLRFKNVSKLDRQENIVCMCPNCHKAIHYGDDKTKQSLIRILLESQKSKFESVNIDISVDDLFELYRV